VRPIRLIKLAILGAVLSGPIAGAAAAGERGVQIARPYESGTVRITARFDHCGVEEGFGFVVGERADGALFAVTADHVLSCDHDENKRTPPQRATRIEVRFAAAPDEPLVAERVTGAPGKDLALVKLPKPRLPLSLGPNWCGHFTRGEQVWFIGRDRRWYVPLDRDSGGIEAGEPDWEGRISVSIDSVRPGSSGAPLIAESGILGMITEDAGNGATALSIETIRRFVVQNRYPWQLAECGTVPTVPVRAPQPPKVAFRVKPEPADAKVRILNIRPPYRDGMELSPGAYRIEVSKPGFLTSDQWFELTAADPVYEVDLAPISAEPSKTFRDRLEDGGEGPLMARVPKGCFRMGDIQGDGDSDEQPVHQVCVDGFAIGVHEVTFSDYDRFAAATNRAQPTDAGWGRGDRPVINVSWHDANAYAEWLSAQTGEEYRLPTEAEWEYAARAGSETRYWWGKEIGRNRANCDGCGSRWDNKQTAPVGSFAANPFGLYDTAGNVWEWTCSEYSERYEGKEQVCVGKDAASRPVLRGGSWGNDPAWVRSAGRFRGDPGDRYRDLGFRLVRLSRI
jgi:formylglycine-generating enzyme required for sulfatase activity